MLKAVTCAAAVFSISRKMNMHDMYKDFCVCNEVVFDYGIYMLCVACMILACVLAATFAIAVLLISRSQKMQEGIRTCVFLGVVFRIWIVYVLCSMYDICDEFAVQFAIALLFMSRNEKKQNTNIRACVC